MPWPVLAGTFLLLTGVGLAWVVGIEVVRATRAPAWDEDAPPVPSWSPAETWLWIIGWTTLGLGLVCLGLTVLWHGQSAGGLSVEVPARAPLVDRIVWALGIVATAGGVAVLLAWFAVRSAQDRQ